MAIKLHPDGCTFPTKVVNGELIITLGYDEVAIPFNFLKEDYPYDDSSFAPSGIMCYLNNGNNTIVMRFDGTVTKYTNNNIVIGFFKFDPKVFADYIVTLSNGCYLHTVNINRPMISPCTIWVDFPRQSKNMVLEFLLHYVYVKLHMEDNKLFVEDVSMNLRMTPFLYLSSEFLGTEIRNGQETGGCIHEHEDRYYVDGQFCVPGNHIVI